MMVQNPEADAVEQITRAPAPDGWKYLDYPHRSLLIQATTQWERTFRAHACEKEPWTVAWIESMVGGRDVLWNVGANVGSYVLIAGARDVATVAIEPGYASYAALCNNVLANRLEGKVTPLCLAIGARTSIEPLAYRDTKAGAASHAFGQAEVKKSVGTLPTLAMSLNHLLNAYPTLPAPSHLLLDVDGAEPDVLAGGDDVLRRYLRSVMVEVKRESEQEQQIAGILTACGYTLRGRFDQRDGRTIEGIYYALWEREAGQ